MAVVSRKYDKYVIFLKFKNKLCVTIATFFAIGFEQNGESMYVKYLPMIMISINFQNIWLAVSAENFKKQPLQNKNMLLAAIFSQVCLAPNEELLLMTLIIPAKFGSIGLVVSE